MLRHVHITSLFSCIKWHAEHLRLEMDKKKNEVRSKDVGSLKTLIKTEIRDLFERERLLQRHLALAEFIMQVKKKLNFKEHLHVEHDILARKEYDNSLLFIQYRICRSLNWARTLQLMCLLSICYDGIPISDFECLRKMFLSAYGYHYLPLFISLEKLGILKYKSMSGNFSSLVRKLNLLPITESLQSSSSASNPSSSNQSLESNAATKALSSVFDSFYVPMLCRLIEYQLFNSQMLDEVTKELGSDCFKSNDSARSFRHHVLAKGLAGQQVANSDKSILIVFIGGCTQTEINALRMLANIKGYKIYILTTNVWTYERFLDQIALNSL